MNDLQQQASNPEYSVWVAASAGTGKTKILTDRVLRLLINGVTFNKILCLTFTNIATLEMQSRIRDKLAKFAEIDSNKLTEELTILLGKKPSNYQLEYAGALYHKLLSSDNGLNVYTIHAFCQKILKLFPFELGINPEFQILDDINAQGILNNIANQIYLDPEHSELISFFLTNFHQLTINEIFSQIINQKVKFKKLFVRKTEYIHPDISRQLSDFYNKVRELLAKYPIEIDLQSNQAIRQFFLTNDHNKRKNILTKPIAKKYPELLERLEYLQEEMFQLDQRRKMQDLVKYSNSLNNLAKILLDKYDAYKNEHSFLDYDDLIYLTQILLTDNNKQWVLSKLDGGIDHLLIDEAQDTSSEQWQIITAIIAEFYSSTKSNSSIFVVGDEKQSIFSFQGANLANFNEINQNLSDNLHNANKKFKNITLEWSYRSTKEIINIVYLTLEHIKKTTPLLFTADNPKILPFRDADNGKVEIWSLTNNEKGQELFWPLPDDHNQSKSVQQLLAEQIASFIKSQIISQKILPSTNLPIRESDFMILVRKRDELIFEIISHLKKYGLAVEDVDRIRLDQNLSVLDLISIAKFVLLPQDDLNLACLLKSPIIGMNEQQLQCLALARGKNSLWNFLQSLKEYEQIYQRLYYFREIYQISHCGNFFSIIIDCLDIRRILVESNGLDSNNLINELIYLSSNYANNVSSSLQSFIYWFDNNQIDIKRNLESSSKVKIMTAHASKGLQAPIVILCDTNSLPDNKDKFIWTEDGQMFSVPQSSDSPDFFKNLKEQQDHKNLQEYIRLLYVAMTRAEDHLIICGYQPSRQLPQNCWYQLVAGVMDANGKKGNDGIIVYETGNQEIQGDVSNITEQTIVSSKSFDDLINKKPAYWLVDQQSINRITKNVKQNYSVTSPLIVNHQLEYGRIFHKILEDAVRINRFSILNQHPLIKTLPINLQQKIITNIDKLLNNTEFMDIEKQELKAELTIGINLNNDAKIGRIDLLAIDQDKLTIIDYKSDSTPPENIQLIKESYIDQLNFYRHTIEKLYPKKQIICKILWLENAHFMTILD